MKNWKTSFLLTHISDQILTEEFSINTGIFQGDCTPGFLFILCLLPLDIRMTFIFDNKCKELTGKRGKPSNPNQSTWKMTNKLQYYNLLDDANVHKTASLKWLTSSSLKRVTEATICAIQEQSITTNDFRSYILNMEISDQCRVRRMEKETI